ncbi:amino acid ABC transporter permease [Nocardioides panacisoli]|uniref:amino acid ABC transporter permease n=1 Tax=Nocardioides panacisoli TaxID=627624 RepID=UPI001C63385E|nr:amino acid ABC transporter permease [Nocardioides panacisoli]QYJ02767.1 amino acid ABC transporter permease [Nocardioides panacisoli]
MSTSVLFDAPGPKTVARHRIYTVVAGAAVLGFLLWALWRLYVEGQFTYDKWEVFLTPRYLEVILVDGLLQTLQMAGTAIVAAVLFGFLFGVGKMSDHAWVRWPSWAVVEFFRAIPVLLLMVFVWFLIGINTSGASYWGVVIALMLYNGSVLAEVFRAGVNSIPKGQGEAAYAVGMRKTQVMNLVLMPQAVKVMLPAIISQCVVALKDTALGQYILAPGLTKVSNQIFLEFDNRIPTIFVVASLYIVVNLILTAFATWLQKRLLGGKKKGVDIEAAAGGGRYDMGGGGGAAV